MTILAPLGTEFLVNTQKFESQYDPAITPLANGGFVVTWADDDGRVNSFTDGIGVKAQIFGAAGRPVGSEFQVAMVRASNAPTPAVTALSNGGFAIAWQVDTNSAWSGMDSYVQVYGADGAKVASTYMGGGISSNEVTPALAGLQNGGFVAVWMNVVSPYFQESEVRGQLYNANGTMTGAAFTVPTQTTGLQSAPSVTGLDGGGFVVTWRDAGGTLGDASGTSIKTQIFDAAGAKIGAEVLVDTQTSGDQVAPVVTKLPGGGFLIVWEDDSTLGDGSGSSVKAQVFAPNGSKIGGEILVDTQAAGNQVAPVVAALPDGGFVVAWEDDSVLGDGSGSSIKAQLFEADGTRAGVEILVDSQVIGNQALPSIAALPGGRIAIVWQDASGTLGDGYGTSIKAQYFDVLHEITGTAGDDVIYGTDANALIDGGAGADHMWGGKGDDTFVVDDIGDVVIEVAGEGIDTVRSSIDIQLADDVEIENLTLLGTAVTGIGNHLANVITGTAAHNVLYGGAGNDTIDGGAGADHMWGGEGDDTFIVDDAGDVVIEAAGQGNDTIMSRISYGLSDMVEVENLILLGNAITGVGNYLDNYILGNAESNNLYGGAGNDTLDGGAGGDLMWGGAGDDTYVVDNAQYDLVTEFAGEGTDRVFASVSYTLTANVENLTLTGTAVTGTGNALDNAITGNAAANQLLGGLGADTLDGGAGNDTLTGGGGIDTFLFAAGLGRDRIVDFTLSGPEQDRIQVSTGLFADFDAVLASASQSGSDVVLTIDDTDSITLANVQLATLNAGHFLFV